MKLKHFLLFSFFFIVTTTIYSQNQKKIYSVTIFKWLKSENMELKQLIKIDSTGNVFLSNKRTGKKVNLKAFTKSINEFISDKNVEKVAGNDDPPRNASVPQNGEQNVYIVVTFLDDYHNESQLANVTSYHCSKEKLKVTDKDYELYKYLEKKDLKIVKSTFE